MAEVTYIDAITRALRDALEEDSRVFLMGQDIAEYGGAFKVTRGLVEEFGRERVVNTPIAESGTVGMAVGAALLGRRPVVEMQFADFITCGFNQVVNVAAKMFWRAERPVPLVIRLPCGGGVGAGPFHSQSLESLFTHVAGLKVVFPAWPQDAYGLLRSAIRDPDPVMFFEHKYLYRRVTGPLPLTPEGVAEEVPLGKARVARTGEHLTLVTYGWMAHLALEAAQLLEPQGISVEVVDLRTLVPLDEDTLLQSVQKTGRVLLVHEAPLTGGFAGELAARVADKAFDFLDAPVRRLTYPDTPVPYQRDLERFSLPSVEGIVEALRELKQY